jgi:hypothetical protein
MNLLLALREEDNLYSALCKDGGRRAERLPHTGSSNSGRGVATVFTPVWTIARAQSVQGK